MTKTALLVCAAPVTGTEVLLAKLGPRADLVVGVDGGAAVCLRAGVVPDVVVGDLDSLDASALRELESRGVPIEVFPSDKDLTDIDLAFDVARSRGADRVLVTGAFAGRLDHTMAAVGSMLRGADLAPMAVEPRMSAWVLTATHRDTLELEGPGTTVSMLAIAGPAIVSSTGVRWPLDNAVLEPLSSLGVSNTVAAARASFRVHEGAVILVSEAVDYAQQATESA